MIVFEGVSYEYAAPGGARPALRDVGFSLGPGELVAVLGANGSGKSTLAKLCNGLLVPGAGSVLVDGMDTRDDARVWDVRSRVGLVFQNPDNQIVGTVVEEDVAFGPENLGVPRKEIRDRVDAALAAVGLTGFERREPHLLSEGQKQRLAVAGALAMRPAYLIMDEPAAMLDPRGREEVLVIMSSLREAGHGILHVSHALADAAWADRALVLAKGEVAYLGPPAPLLEDASLLAGAGLALPPVGELAAELRSLGAPVPGVMLAAEGIVEALWPS